MLDKENMFNPKTSHFYNIKKSYNSTSYSSLRRLTGNFKSNKSSSNILGKKGGEGLKAEEQRESQSVDPGQGKMAMKAPKSVMSSHINNRNSYTESAAHNQNLLTKTPTPSQRMDQNEQRRQSHNTQYYSNLAVQLDNVTYQSSLIARRRSLSHENYSPHIQIKNARSSYLGSLKKLTEMEKSADNSYSSNNNSNVSNNNMSIDGNTSNVSSESQEKLYRNFHSNPNKLVAQRSYTNVLWIWGERVGIRRLYFPG